MWEEIAAEIRRRTQQEWDLLAAGTWRDPHHKADYDKYKSQVDLLEKKGLAHSSTRTGKPVLLPLELALNMPVQKRSH